MPIIQIAPVERKGMKLLISLFGMSETGKTLSALKLAAGIEPDPRKRGLMDTEGGQRGRAYMDAIEGGYMYGALTAPFTPERYMEGLQDFVAAGVTTLAVDSSSHAWFAEGGVLDMVEAATEKNGVAQWAKPKRRLGKLTGQWLGCGLHLILCARGKQPYVEEIVNGKKTYVQGAVVPVQEKSLRFDLTIMAHMLGDGKFSVDRLDGGKCPGTLRPIFASGAVMDESMGRKLIAWVGGQDALSPEQRALYMEADRNADLGTAALQTWWKALSIADQKFLKPNLENYKSKASSADFEKRQAGTSNEGADMGDPFAPAALPSGIQHVGNEADAA